MQAFTSCISTSLVLVLLGIVVLFTLIARKLSNSVRENLVVTVLLADDATEKQILACEERLKNKSYIHAVNYISREQALKEHIAAMGTDPEEFMGSNPFPASFELQMKADYAHTDSLRWITRRLKADALVSDVVYQQDLVENLNRNLQRVGLVLLVLAALLTFVSFGLINSMVKMSLYANRFLIHTMKLVGASWRFIRKPFLVRAFRIGFVAALLADGVLLGGLYGLLSYDPTMTTFITWEMTLIMSLAVFGFGVLITLFCSYLSLNRFLKMKAGELYEM